MMITLSLEQREQLAPSAAAAGLDLYQALLNMQDLMIKAQPMFYTRAHHDLVNAALSQVGLPVMEPQRIEAAPAPLPRQGEGKGVGSPDAEKIAAKFREMAEKMQKQIDAKLHPATANQNYTSRRAGIIDSMQAEGRRLQRIQAGLNALADGWELNTLPDPLRPIRSRAEVELLLTYDAMPPETHEDAHKRALKFAQDTPDFIIVKQCLVDLLDPNIGIESPDQRKLREAKRRVMEYKIEGFFPTPPDVVAMMLDRADIQPHHRILEPSAGMGHIADAIIARNNKLELDLVEYNADLRTILTMKNYNLAGRDIFEFFTDEPYDRIIMNPPFESFGDIRHVQHCYQNLLAEGGRLVAIMSASTFFRNASAASDFRDWLVGISGHYEELPEDAFMKSDKPTGVRAYIVTLDK